LLNYISMTPPMRSIIELTRLIWTMIKKRMLTLISSSV
jgi:hypothetical protein